MSGAVRTLIRPPKARRGDRIAVVSPSFAAPGFAPAVHEQAMRRLHEVTGLIPVEYPTTRQLGASPRERARDLNAAFADPDVRAVLTSIGGDDQIAVIGHLDAALVRADPKPFLGYSDNTNLHQWLWTHGVASFYGGSSQVHLGPGPGVDDEHARSLRAALLTGETLELTRPSHSEDHGHDWRSAEALTDFGRREPTEPWAWAGPERVVAGPAWGGCLEVLQWVLAAGRFPANPGAVAGSILLVETSEERPSAGAFGRMLVVLGERGLLGAVAGVLVARPPVSDHDHNPDADERARLRDAQREMAIDIVGRYNSDAVVCVGVPFGHTRPQWIVPHGGGPVTLDAPGRRVLADYS